MSDDEKAPRKFRIADGTIIAPHGFLVFRQRDLQSGIALDAVHGGEVFLWAADAAGTLDGRSAHVEFGPSLPGISFGRYVTSQGTDFVALQPPPFPFTPASLAEGAAPLNTPANMSPLVGPVVINEIAYHPVAVPGGPEIEAYEYIELKNITDSPVPLFDEMNPTHTWRLGSATEFRFPTNVVLPARALIVVVAFDPANLALLQDFRTRNRVPAGVPVFGPMRDRLDNSGETVALFQPGAPLGGDGGHAGFVPMICVDEVTYSSSGAWPALANGQGLVLGRRESSQYGNDVINWVAAVPSPGMENTNLPLLAPTILSQPHDESPDYDDNLALSVGVTGSSPMYFQWKFNGVEIPGATNSMLVLGNVQLEDGGEYALRIQNAAGSATSSIARVTVIFEDQDRDELPTKWELENGLNPTVTDSLDDLDGDGMNNLQEFNAGTDPRNASSALRARVAANPADGGALIRFHAVAGRQYAIEYCDNFNTGAWSLLNTIHAATPYDCAVADPVNGSRRFYRVVLLPR